VTTELQSVSDEDLARQSQAGSLSAFEQLVYRYENRIHGFLLQSCRNQADARELTQETFVKAFQAIHQFDGQHRFSAWLFTIARRKCIDHHRLSSRVLADGQPPESPDYSDPAKLLSQREESQNLWQLARRLLPDPQYHALWLRYVEDMAVAEIAGVLRKTQTHVKVLLYRARQTLGRELNRLEHPMIPLASTALQPAELSHSNCYSYEKLAHKT